MFSTKKTINNNIFMYLCSRINIKKYMDIKTIIETKIKDANLTKKEVAERMGIIPNNINAMLANPSWPTLEKLSGALGIPVSELVADNQDEPEYDPPRWGETGTTSKEPQQKCPYCGHNQKINVE